MAESTIVIDISSKHIRAGFSGEEAPRCVIPCLVGRPKNPGIMVGSEQKDYVVGAGIEEDHPELRLSSPMKLGRIDDVDDLGRIIGYIFERELQVAPQGCNVLIVESGIPSRDRESLVGLLFDTIEVEGVCLVSSAACCTFSAGTFTGFSVQIEENVTYLVPVIDGYAARSSGSQFDLGTKDGSDALFQPSILQREFEGLHAQVYATIWNYDNEARRDLLRRIVVCGSGPEIAEVPARLTVELRSRLPPALASIVNACAAPMGADSIWVGGSILSSIAGFDARWITRAEYGHSGPSIVNLLCI